jgi:hypothetical protein
MVEQSLKVAAAAAARAPSSISSAALNLATQQANVNVFTNATMPIMAAVAAATNPLSSMQNSFFSSAVDTQHHHQQQQTMITTPMSQNHIQPNVTSVSATIVIPNSSNSNFMPSTNFMDAFDIPKTSSFNYGLNCSNIPSTSSQMLNNFIPQRSLPSESFNVSSMISPPPPTTNSQMLNDILFPQSSLQSTSANQVPISFSPFQINPSTSNAKDATFDDLSMFDFNDLEMFPTNKNSSSTNIETSIFPTTSETDINLKATEAPIPDFGLPPQPSLSSSKMTTKLSSEMETDKELNHWLSLAVGGGLPDEDAPGSPLSNFEETANDHLDLFPTKVTGVSLDPIMFTPPDSPTQNDSRDKGPLAAFTDVLSSSKNSPTKSNSTLFPSSSKPDSLLPPSSTETLIFMSKPISDESNTRIPVYKQKKSIFSSATITLDKVLDKASKTKKADEYSFTDDDEEEEPLSKSVGFDFFSDDVSGDNEIEPKSQEETSETVTKKKSVADSKPAIDETREEIKPERNNVAEIIRKRKENLKSLTNVFMYSEILEGDDVVVPIVNDPTSSTDDNKEEANEKEYASEESEPSPEPMDTIDDEAEYESPPTLTVPYCETSSSNGIPILRIKTEIPDIVNSPSQTSTTTAAADEAGTVKEETRETDRVLPKLVIKLRRESVTSPISKKRKKKHKKKKDDTDWEPSEKRRKKHKSKHRHHREYTETSIILNTALTNDIKPEISLINGFTRKISFSPFTDPSVIERLSYFGNASGDSPKGTFVVCKQDIFKNDCPLWKVDNQNLLQKYPEITEKIGTKHYKNSSTYSGWCDQVAAGYLIVQVKYHKHSRAETIVEPQIPIIDLIPVITEVFPGSSDDGFGLRNEPIIDDIFEPLPPGSINMSSTKATVRSHMKSFTQAMLQHAVSLTFLQNVKDSNDWDFLCAMNEVENMTLLGKQRINDKVKWGQRFEVMLTIYPNINVNNEFIGDEICQACGDKVAKKYLNLYSNESYNYDSLEIQELPDIDGESPLVAIQFCICSRCSQLALTYHRLHHMKYNTFRYCEDMIENMSILRPDLPIDSLVSLCLSKRSWQRKLINEYAILWRKVQENEL